jgi:DNA polymerase-3 subunit alpha/error-prone DNA polymerase
MHGVNSPADVCQAARAMGYRAMALTDTDNLYGLWAFLEACRQHDIRPIVGAQVTDPAAPARRALCLVENSSGYANLCRIITDRRIDPRFDLAAAVTDHGAGLVVLTDAPDLLEHWHEAGVIVAAALGPHPLKPGHCLKQAAARLNVALVATPNSVVVNPRDMALHRILRAIDRNTSLSRLDPHSIASADAWLAPPEVYRQRFAACPQAVIATAAIAERLAFTGPAFGLVLPPWRHNRNPGAALRQKAYDGARKRYGPELSEAVVERLEYELKIIDQMGFAAYFLIVADIVRRSTRICGRGSGAASLVAFCLEITNVCPLKHNLYFERFLNPGRTDPPDIDVDFAWDERDAVIADVLSRHEGHAARVASFVLFQPRMAVRETAKVFGLADGEISRVTQRIPWLRHAADADLCAARRKGLPQPQDQRFAEPWPAILAAAQRLIGIPRCICAHPGGVVITPEPITAYVPIQSTPKGAAVIQWDKDATEAAGLVKIDLLGNRSLAVIRDALTQIKTNGMVLDESQWEPEDDLETQETIAQGRTMGCFYIESPAMRQLQLKTRTGDFEHIVIHSSIIRPAANDTIGEYIRRLHGGRWQPVHPLLDDVLAETFGILVYQEDVSRVAAALAGFSPAEADGLRKILSKKDRNRRLTDLGQRFADGAAASGLSQDQIEAVWTMMMSFSGYSFCKPHSASYARVSFQAAYLKAHFPAEFMAAVISNQGGFYSTFAYVSEARRLGLTVLPPDVNRSQRHWTGGGTTLQAGLMAIKVLGETTIRRILDQRRQGCFTDSTDFWQRVRPENDEALALIRAGALDGLAGKSHASGSHQAALLWEQASCRGRTAARRPGLFDATPAAPALPPDDPLERLRGEFAVLGFLCAGHPMSLFRSHRLCAKAIMAKDLPQCVGRRIAFAGWLITGKQVHTKHGEAMEFLTFEDETGIVETTFFPETYRRFGHLLDGRKPYVLKGRVEQDWGAVTLTVEAVTCARILTDEGAVKTVWRS